MLAERLSRIGPSPALEVVQAAEQLRRSGVDVADLSIGEPDFATPEHVKAAARAAIDANLTKYTANAGIAELRAAIVARYRHDFAVEFSEGETIVTAGGKQALFNAMLALVGPGDEVITHAPGWPTIVEQVRLADATPVIVRAHADQAFALGAAMFVDAITPRTRAIVINSPCNPTGAVISEEALANVAEAAAARGIWVVLDLCYEHIVFDGRAHNLARVLVRRMRDRTVLAGSASKAYAMTGWRCGWAVAPAPVIAACNAIQSHSTSNVSSISQWAALAALDGAPAVRAADAGRDQERRDLALAWLSRDTRLRCHQPAGAFYLFADIGDLLSPTGLGPRASSPRPCSTSNTWLSWPARPSMRRGSSASRWRRLVADCGPGSSACTGSSRPSSATVGSRTRGGEPAMTPDMLERLRAIVGADHVHLDEAMLEEASIDGLGKLPHRPDVVVRPVPPARSPTCCARATSGECRSSRAVPARAIPAGPSPPRAAWCCRWPAWIGSSRSTSPTCWLSSSPTC